MAPLILASSSPRRRALLNFFSLPYEEIPHAFDERSIPWEGSAIDYAKILAEGKVKEVAHRYPGRLILAADTVVAMDGRRFGKPKSKTEAAHMLQELCGKWHTVVTGVSLASDNSLATCYEETQVLLSEIDDEALQAYLSCDEWKDKAGSYAIQGIGSLFVKRIEGCFYNVMGLPLVLVHSMLEKVGINLWKFVQ